MDLTGFDQVKSHWKRVSAWHVALAVELCVGVERRVLRGRPRRGSCVGINSREWAFTLWSTVELLIKGDVVWAGCSELETDVPLFLRSAVIRDWISSVSSRRLAKSSSAARLRNVANVICGFIGEVCSTEEGDCDNCSWANADGWTELIVVPTRSAWCGSGKDEARDSFASVTIGTYN